MSPWIYYELMTCKYIRKPIPTRLIPKELLDEQVIAKSASIPLEYTVDFTDFVDLCGKDLNRWAKHSNNEGISSLDKLYSLFPLEN